MVKLEPDYAPAYYLLGYVRSKLKDYTGANVAVDRTLRLNDRLPDAWFLKALLLEKQGELPEAIEAYTTVTQLKPTHPHAWQNLAKAHEKNGNPTAARQALRDRQKVIDEMKKAP